MIYISKITDQRGALKARQLARMAVDSHQDTGPAARHLKNVRQTNEIELP